MYQRKCDVCGLVSYSPERAQLHEQSHLVRVEAKFLDVNGGVISQSVRKLHPRYGVRVTTATQMLSCMIETVASGREIAKIEVTFTKPE